MNRSPEEIANEVARKYYEFCDTSKDPSNDASKLVELIAVAVQNERKPPETLDQTHQHITE